ncbi:hypothetical protein L208DRAFT_1336477 [Tricholoma matsutake]|nr:hypothetical protein L208DRAFT_1336477 [Tricholoma matsutake 945]
MASSVQNEEVETEESFINTILKPGSSLNPTFLAVLDGAFACLFSVLLVLAFLTSGNIHVFVLLGIEFSLWASVKWFVNELKNIPIVECQEGKGKLKNL